MARPKFITLSSIWIFIRTVIVVTIVTGLVWLYAEGESLKTNTVEVDVQFVSPNANLLIKPDTARRVKVVIRCSASKKAELDRTLTTVKLDVGADDTGKPSSHHSVILKERLAQSSLFQKLGGIIIVETQPQTLEVDTERLQSIVLPVRIEAGDVLLTSTSAVEPQSVTLTVTAAIAPQLDSAFVEARLNAETLRKLPVDTAQTLQVPLTLPDQWKKLGVAIPPTIAKVTVTVRKQTETFVIKTIPINLSGPPTALAKYSVVFDDEQRLLRDVTVTGPHDVIEKIRKDQKLVRADLWVTADELEKNAGKGPVKGTLSITAPANVTYDPPAMVTYTVEAVSR